LLGWAGLVRAGSGSGWGSLLGWAGLGSAGFGWAWGLGAWFSFALLVIKK